MTKDTFYRIGKYSIFLLLIIILGIGVLTTDRTARSPFLEKPITMRVIAILILLLGIHFLFFKERWIQDWKEQMTKFLQNKPKIIQKWLSVHKSYRHNQLIVPVAGIFAIILGVLFFIATFNR
jgi:hypothetical protein